MASCNYVVTSINWSFIDNSVLHHQPCNAEEDEDEEEDEEEEEENEDEEEDEEEEEEEEKTRDPCNSFFPSIFSPYSRFINITKLYKVISPCNFVVLLMYLLLLLLMFYNAPTL